MDRKAINIYQTSRNDKGYTQEKSAELIGVSVDSIRAYEGGRTIPPNDVVCRMVEIYGTTYLAYQHIMNSSEVARKWLPSVELKDLPEAVLCMLKELEDVIGCKGSMIEIACDGTIKQDERPRANKIIQEIDELIGALQALKIALS